MAHAIYIYLLSFFSFLFLFVCLTVSILVLLYAHVKRISVSFMRDFFKALITIIVSLLFIHALNLHNFLGMYYLTNSQQLN